MNEIIRYSLQYVEFKFQVKVCNILNRFFLL